MRGYADFTSAFLDLGDRLLAEGRRLDAALCYRAAELFLKPSDERKAQARRRFVELVREVYGIGPQHTASVSFEQGALPAYRFGEPCRGTTTRYHQGSSQAFVMHVTFVAAEWNVSRPERTDGGRGPGCTP